MSRANDRIGNRLKSVFASLGVKTGKVVVLGTYVHIDLVDAEKNGVVCGALNAAGFEVIKSGNVHLDDYDGWRVSAKVKGT